MTLFLLVQCFALIFLLFCSAFFSSAETAMFSLDPMEVYRIKKSRKRAGERISRLLASPHSLLSTVLIGNTIVNISAAGLGYSVAEHLYKGYGEMISIPAMLLLLLVFGEIAPKRFAIAKAEKLAPAYSSILLVLIKVLAPFRALLEHVASFLKKELRTVDGALTEDEFLTVVEVGEEEGVLDEEERTMVDGIISLEDIQASDVMTPRVDLLGVDLEDSLDEIEKTARSSKYRYLPVYKESLDHPKGFLDILGFLLSENRNVKAATIEPFFVPETAPLDTVLGDFRGENKRIAFVVDEYGGTAGLITRGDILEEIITDVGSEHGDEKPEIQKVAENQWIIDGSTSLEDINYELDLELEAEGADRIAGWVNAQAEHITKMGEVIEAQGCRVTVELSRRNRITLLSLEKIKT